MEAPPLQSRLRVRVFVDYWNFQLTLNGREAKARGLDDFRFEIDWRKLGPFLARRACEAMGVDPSGHSFDGVHIYTSYNATTEDGRKFHKWATTWLDKQPGVQVECRERRAKRNPKCPSCHGVIELCPHCNVKMVATIEKGVDTFIATDMIRLAWEDGYDVAVLATLDSDLVPAVDFLRQKAKKVVQAGFPPKGTHLATSCWASFDVFPDREEIRRVK